MRKRSTDSCNILGETEIICFILKYGDVNKCCCEGDQGTRLPETPCVYRRRESTAVGCQEKSGERSPCLSGQESAVCACGTFLHELALQLGAERCFSVVYFWWATTSLTHFRFTFFFFPEKVVGHLFFRLNTEEFKGL